MHLHQEKSHDNMDENFKLFADIVFCEIVFVQSLM